jgi:hypothetical protein
VTESDLRQRLADTQFVVSATHDEAQFLWEKFSDEAIYKTPLNTYRWEQLNPGVLLTLGTLADMPVCLHVWWVRIDGVLVLFHEATSQVVDHRMVDKWVGENLAHCKDGRCDAANFHHCLHFVQKFGGR